MLMAQDMDRAVQFYSQTMGLDVFFATPHWSELKLGDAIIALHGGGDGSINKTGLSIQYPDVKEMHSMALAAGAANISSPEQREGEPIILSSIRDTEGNEIMLTQYVG